MDIALDGRLSMSHGQYENIIEQHGGKISKTVKRATTMLLANAYPNSAKSSRAEELGIPIVSEEYVTSCIRANRRLDIEDYVIPKPLVQVPRNRRRRHMWVFTGSDDDDSKYVSSASSSAAASPVSASRSTRQVFTIHIEVEHIVPKIWRRFVVYSDITLHELHGIIQAVMGWQNQHKYRFLMDGGVTYMRSPFELHDPSSKPTRLHSLFDASGGSMGYEYDMGDSWMHKVRIESLGTATAGVHYPICLGGARACPIEDSGSVDGYNECVEVVGSRPQDEEGRERLKWIRETAPSWNPERFSLAIVNARIAAI